MSGPQLQVIRRKLAGTDTVAFGKALGLRGNDSSIAASVRRLETRDRIPGWFAILATKYAQQGDLT